MDLMEFQGKELFRLSGIRVPAARLVNSANEINDIRLPVLLKSQVLTGGRGKAGGIRRACTREELESETKALFNLTIRGNRVSKLLAVEEEVEIIRELYVSITYRGSDGKAHIIACADGGMEIENVAAADPSRIIDSTIEPCIGVTGYQGRYIAKCLGLEDAAALTVLLKKLYDCFTRYDCTLTEINPLALTTKGLCALDAKVVLDDAARFRHKELYEKLESEQGDAAPERRQDTITFVKLDGDVGLISDGAGTGMLALDRVNEGGGSVSSFCELGGVTNAEVMYTALCETLSCGAPKSLLIVFIGGFNRMDEMASGIMRYKKERGLELPISIRMCGTMEEEGKRILSEVGISTQDSFDEAVLRAIDMAAGGGE